MAKPKYLVFKVEELQKFLQPDAVAYITHLISFIDASRAESIRAAFDVKAKKEMEAAQAENRPPNMVDMPSLESPLYWVLNMGDRYALPTIEHYLSLIDEDSEGRNTPGVKAAAQAAREVRNRGKFINSKLPD